MEFLKDIFGSEALTYDQLAEKLKGSKDIKLGNLAGGQYVQREKLTAVETERDTLKTQLGEANKTIEGFKAMDIEGVKRAAGEWETKYNTDTQALKDQLAATQYGFAVKEAVANLKFSSESAKKAFVADLTAKKLPLQDGKLLGLEDFAKTYKENDPNAFAPEGGVPKIVFGGGKKPPVAAVTKEQYAKLGYTDRLKIKTENPELYKQLTE